MTKTATVVSFGLYVSETRQDSSYVFSAGLQPFSKLNDIKTQNITSEPYATYESNFWLLDGTYKFKPANNAAVHIGLMSLEQSDDMGAFTVPPTLEINFSATHSTNGLIIQGAEISNDFASSIRIQFFDEEDAQIQDDTYAPDVWNFFTAQAVADFKRILITFNSTNKPNRFLRLTGIEFGTLTYFTSADIKSCTVIEQFNPLSVEIPIGTCELSLHTNDPTFSIIAPSGDYIYLKDRQPLDVYEEVGAESIFIGQFFLDTWENVSENVTKFTALDILGVLDKLPYAGGAKNTTAGDLLDEMLEAQNIPYSLDASLSNVPLVGTLKVGTYRDALQQICFAIGASITSARAGTLQIMPFVLASGLSAYDHIITKAQKGMSQSLALKTLVTGVEITYGAGAVYGVYNQALSSNVKENIIEIKDAVFVTASNVATIAQRVYDYYQQRYLQKVRLYAPESAVGKSVLIDTLYNRQIGGIVEKMTLDLSGGFRVDAEIIGDVIV
ncbi:MAG: hypothetical protein PHQ36_04265 [Anaerolineales bacterium]|nr:hypothetical protein [Anaerolineales bacterium]